MYTEELYLDELERYKTVSLRSVYVIHKETVNNIFPHTDAFYEPILIHCSLVNKDFNFLNDKKSDVIAIIYPEPGITSQRHKFEKVNSTKKFINPSNHIKMYLTDIEDNILINKGDFSICYELNFSIE